MVKFTKTLNKALTNKYVLYVVTFLAVTNILGYMAAQNFTSVIFFVLLAFLTQYFSKNMTVILLTAMIGTSVLFVSHNYGLKVREGLEARKKADDDNENAKRQKTLDMSSKAEHADDGNDDDGNDDDEHEGFSDGYQVNRDKTNLSAFKKMHQQLGPQGVKGLEMDTKELMSQQKDLMKMMEGMGPLMEQAKSMMNVLDPKTLKGMTDLVGGLGLGGK